MVRKFNLFLALSALLVMSACSTEGAKLRILLQQSLLATEVPTEINEGAITEVGTDGAGVFLNVELKEEFVSNYLAEFNNELEAMNSAIKILADMTETIPSDKVLGESELWVRYTYFSPAKDTVAQKIVENEHLVKAYRRLTGVNDSPLFDIKTIEFTLVETVKQSLPIEVSDALSLVDASMRDNAIEYTYRIEGLPASAITEDIISGARAIQLQDFVNTYSDAVYLAEDMASYDLSFRFLFQAPNGEELMEFTIPAREIVDEIKKIEA